MPEIAPVNAPPVMVPLHSTPTVTVLLPALKVAPELTTILLTSVKAMFSGASEPPLLRSTSPVMVSTPLFSLKPSNVPPVTVPPVLSTVASVKSPPVMAPKLSRYPSSKVLNVPPLMAP